MDSKKIWEEGVMDLMNRFCRKIKLEWRRLHPGMVSLPAEP